MMILISKDLLGIDRFIEGMTNNQRMKCLSSHDNDTIGPGGFIVFMLHEVSVSETRCHKQLSGMGNSGIIHTILIGCHNCDDNDIRQYVCKDERLIYELQKMIYTYICIQHCDIYKKICKKICRASSAIQDTAKPSKEVF